MTIKLSQAIFLTCLLLISSCNCNKIKKPDADNTPPICSWEVHVLDDDTKQEFPNGGTFDLKKRYNVRVFFKVSDNDGGVKKISVSGSGTTAYPQVNTYYNWGSQNELSWVEDFTHSPDAQNMVQKSGILMKQFDFTPKPGNSSGGGLQFQVITPNGGTLDLFGSGENYYGGKCTSRLTITATPKSP